MNPGDTRSWWAGRSVLVTGCTGFLGCWLTRRLVDLDARVVGLARHPVADGHPFDRFRLCDRVALVQANVDDFDVLAELMRDENIAVVFHLAAQSQVAAAAQDPRRTLESNVRGTWNVLEAVRCAGGQARVVIASSGTVYGTPAESPCTEDMPLRATSPYDASKACAEIVAESYHRGYGIPVCVVRCANLYGGGDLNVGRLVPGTIRAVLQDEAPVIRSDGRAERDFLYAGDAARGYLMLAEAANRPGIAGEAFNLSAGSSTSVLEVVHSVLRLSGRSDLTPTVLAEPSREISRMWLSAHKVKSVVGWVAEVGLEAGLARTIAWYRDALTPGAVPSADGIPSRRG